MASRTVSTSWAERMQLDAADEFGFSFADYSRVLRAFLADGYAVTGFQDYLDNPRARHLVLRHDIDNDIQQARRVARLDAEAGCSSAFFLRVHARGYNLLSLSSLEAIREMTDLGHEVGLHLEGGIGDIVGGSMDEWADRQRAVFEAATGRELTGFSVHEPARMGGIEYADTLLARWAAPVRYHAYESKFTTPTMKYLSDSSGNWREGHFGHWVGKAPLIQVLTHPFWWFERIPAENY
jgi:hypothetical protein